MSLDDAKLARLLDLGFDYDKCVMALHRYDDLQEASNWILTSPTQDVLTPTTTQPAMPNNSPAQVRSHNDTSYQDQQELERQRAEALKRASESRKQKRLDQQARQRALNDIKEDRDHIKQLKPVRANAKQDQAIVADTTQQTALAYIQQDLKKQKQLERVAKQRVLDDIKMDRLDKQQRKQQRQQPSSPIATDTSADQHDIGASTSKKTALIQFKLTDGSVVRQPFDGTALLETLYEFVTDQETTRGRPMHSDEHIGLISAFPRRTFGPEQKQLSVQEAGFLPNVSLNVTRASTSTATPTLETTANDEQMHSASEDEEIYSASEDEDDEDDEDNFIRQPIADPHRSRRRHTDRSRFARQNRVTNPNWSWGRQGHRLGDDMDTLNNSTPVSENMTQQDEENRMDADRRQDMLTAIERRASTKPDVNNDSDKVDHNKSGRKVVSLKEVCSSQVAAILSSSSKDTQRLLKNLVSISPDLSSLLLSRLMATKKLDRLSLSRLVRHCYLQHVILESYVYATDSLLEELSYASTLTKLILRGCDMITDVGIRNLEGLKYLEYLDISNCKITDKGLKSITKLPSLGYLDLSKTHISDAGLQWFTKSTHCQPSLETLLLTGCKGIKSANTFSSLQDFSSLAHLSLGGTCIERQRVAPMSMKQLNESLESLDICHTGITDDDLVQLIAGFGHLKELKLGGCHKITTNGLARFANGMSRLEIIQFPNREHDLDDILIRFIDCPLQRLDLTGFLLVSDHGAQHIAKMTRLEYLSLTGTKVTDNGVAQLKGLHELKQLYLDQTGVTDIGLLQLKGLRKLNTLSLGRNEISNKSLQLMGNIEETNYAQQLRTLNLQHCINISDQGVKALANMPNLTNLNLDHTGVSLQCVDYLKDLIFLKPVRLLGIEKVQDDEMDVDL